MMTSTYFSVTSRMIDQKTMDRMPSTLSGVTRNRMMAVEDFLRGVERLVPMSPKTTPMAPSVSVDKGLFGLHDFPEAPFGACFID